METSLVSMIRLEQKRPKKSTISVIYEVLNIGSGDWRESKVIVLDIVKVKKFVHCSRCIYSNKINGSIYLAV